MEVTVSIPIKIKFKLSRRAKGDWFRFEKKLRERMEEAECPYELLTEQYSEKLSSYVRKESKIIKKGKYNTAEKDIILMVALNKIKTDLFTISVRRQCERMEAEAEITLKELCRHPYEYP